MRWHESTLAQIDAWIAQNGGELTRPEAIRRLVEQGLVMAAAPGKGKHR